MSERAENETTFRFDEEERVLWGCTADPPTARRWQRAGLEPMVLGRVKGEARTWEIRLAANSPGWRKRWSRAFHRAVPGWPSFAPGRAEEAAADPSQPGEGG